VKKLSFSRNKAAAFGYSDDPSLLTIRHPQILISKLTFPETKRGTGRLCRFTLSISWEEGGETHGVAHEGCILYRKIDTLSGESVYEWGLPKIRYMTRPYSSVSPATYERVLKALQPYLQYVGEHVVPPPSARDMGAPEMVKA